MIITDRDHWRGRTDSEFNMILYMKLRDNFCNGMGEMMIDEPDRNWNPGSLNSCQKLYRLSYQAPFFLSSLTVTFLPLQMIFAFKPPPLYPGHSTNCNKIGEIWQTRPGFKPRPKNSLVRCFNSCSSQSEQVWTDDLESNICTECVRK